jgi:preprotein translocase subunit YajC
MMLLHPAFLLLLQAGPFDSPLAPIILMVVIFYLVLFMPMRKRQRKTERMLKNLSNGDRVVTTGGLIGTIVSVSEDDNSLTLRVKPDNVKLQFSRGAVTGLIGEEEKE